MARFAGGDAGEFAQAVQLALVRGVVGEAFAPDDFSGAVEAGGTASQPDIA